MCTHAKWPKRQTKANKKHKNVCNRGRNEFELMQIRVERPQNRVWVLEKEFFELNNLTCSTWGNMHNVHTCKMAKEAKIGQQKA